MHLGLRVSKGARIRFGGAVKPLFATGLIILPARTRAAAATGRCDPLTAIASDFLRSAGAVNTARVAEIPQPGIKDIIGAIVKRGLP